MGTIIAFLLLVPYWKQILIGAGVLIFLVIVISARRQSHARAAYEQQLQAEQERRHAAEVAAEVAAKARVAEAEAAARAQSKANLAEIARSLYSHGESASASTGYSPSDCTVQFEPPEVLGDMCLSYSYRDVEFFCPDDCKTLAAAVPAGKQLSMSYEPENPYDSSAVAVYYDKQKIGYMYRNKLRDMLNDFADDPEKDFLPISTRWTEKPAFDLFFYKSACVVIREMESNPGAKSFKLTGNRNEDAQNALGLCSVGDVVTVHYDGADDKYLADTDYGFIGNFPASASRLFDQFSNYDARICEIEQDDETDKYSVRVIVVPD